METIGELGKSNKDAMTAFHRFMDAVIKENKLDTKTKELISLGIAIARCCKYCISFHVKNALDAGANREEIIEASLVAVLMGGGPSLAYITEVRKALDEFLDK